MRERRGIYRAWVGKSERKRSLERPRQRWEDNIRIDFQEVGCGSIDWIDLAQDRGRWRDVVKAVLDLQAPQNAGNSINHVTNIIVTNNCLQLHPNPYLQT